MHLKPSLIFEKRALLYSSKGACNTFLPLEFLHFAKLLIQGCPENEDPLKILRNGSKLLITTSRLLQTLGESKKQHGFQSKILTRVFVFQNQKKKTSHQIIYSLRRSCFRSNLAKRELCARSSLLPTSLNIFAPLRCGLLASLTFSYLRLAER